MDGVEGDMISGSVTAAVVPVVPPRPLLPPAVVRLVVGVAGDTAVTSDAVEASLLPAVTRLRAAAVLDATCSAAERNSGLFIATKSAAAAAWRCDGTGAGEMLSPNDQPKPSVAIPPVPARGRDGVPPPVGPRFNRGDDGIVPSAVALPPAVPAVPEPGLVPR